MTTTVDLLAAVCAHLAEFELPTIASVHGGLWPTHRGLGADLAPDATTTIPLPTLRHAAIVVEEARA